MGAARTPRQSPRCVEQPVLVLGASSGSPSWRQGERPQRPLALLARRSSAVERRRAARSAAAAGRARAAARRRPARRPSRWRSRRTGAPAARAARAPRAGARAAARSPLDLGARPRREVRSGTGRRRGRRRLAVAPARGTPAAAAASSCDRSAPARRSNAPRSAASCSRAPSPSTRAAELVHLVHRRREVTQLDDQRPRRAPPPEALDLGLDPPLVPAELRRHRAATRRGAAPSARTARARPAARAGSAAAARRRRSAPARAAPRTAPRRAGRAAPRRSAARARRARPRSPAPARRRGRSGRRAPRATPRRRPRRAGSAPGSIGCPSGISWVRQGAWRPSRSTSRSTAIFAIRRQVVSLPPVIVISPLEVSYSSALREMSTDLRVSPVEISGRTPA